MDGKVIIVVAVIVVLLVIVIAYSDYIGWFFRLVRGEIRHNKKINELKNKNVQNRYLRKKEIENAVKAVDEVIRQHNYPINKEYKLDDGLERKLRYSRFDDKYVKELFLSISKFMGVNSDEIEFKIRRTSSKTETGIAGMYNWEEKSVVLEVSTYATTNQLISTLAHELSHHILMSNGFRLKKRDENEVYTDVAAIYMGFYKYFYEAYKNKSRIIYDGEFLELVDRKKLGYIGYKDVKIVEKISRKYKRKRSVA